MRVKDSRQIGLVDIRSRGTGIGRGMRDRLGDENLPGNENWPAPGRPAFISSISVNPSRDILSAPRVVMVRRRNDRF